MNNLQSNERHLADKLRQAPVPDVNRGWEQMRELLDREKPEAVIGGWAGNKRWWWMGITAALIMAALWLTQELNQREQKNVAEKTQNGNNEQLSAGKSNKTINNSTDNRTTVQKDNNSAGDVINQESGDAKNDEVKTPEAITNNATRGETVKVTKSEKQERLIPNKIRYSRGIDKPLQARANNNKTVVDIAVQSKSDIDNSVIDIYQNNTVNRDVRIANFNTSLLVRDNITPSDKFNSLSTSASDAIAVSGKTDKAYLKQLRKIVEKDNRRMSRSGMRGGFGDDGREITFAAGITVPQTFALGQQQASPYSVSGKSSRFMDYLPAPFFQYHINNKLFLQTEFHFQSPQYTDRLLLARSTTEPSTNVRLEKNVYLEKLYYFNIPLNIYYTPARNFSIGSGLQYSSLLSGVASFEERRVEGQATTNYQSVTRRFKDDSVAAKFAPSEWRYQFDANYYFKRFTLGLRYNQALKDFVDLQVNPALPATQDRNKSFLLYLRFNIWEERKKD